MTEESTFRKYIQFDGTNWSNWKYRVNVLLEEKNLLQYVENDLEELRNATNDEKVKEYHTKEQKKCKSIIVQCVADSHLEYIKDKITTREIFNALKAVFERKSVAVDNVEVHRYR